MLLQKLPGLRVLREVLAWFGLPLLALHHEAKFEEKGKRNQATSAQVHREARKTQQLIKM